MYQLIDKVMGIYRNLDIAHPLLDLSLVSLSERETISEISIKASKFTNLGHFLLTNRVYLTFAGNYTNDNTQSNTR